MLGDEQRVPKPKAEAGAEKRGPPLLVPASLHVNPPLHRPWPRSSVAQVLTFNFEQRPETWPSASRTTSPRNMSKRTRPEPSSISGADAAASQSTARCTASHRIAEQSWGEKTSEQGRSRELDNSTRAHMSLRSSPRTNGGRARVRRYAPSRAHDRGGARSTIARSVTCFPSSPRFELEEKQEQEQKQGPPLLDLEGKQGPPSTTSAVDLVMHPCSLSFLEVPSIVTLSSVSRVARKVGDSEAGWFSKVASLARSAGLYAPLRSSPSCPRFRGGMKKLFFLLWPSRTRWNDLGEELEGFNIRVHARFRPGARSSSSLLLPLHQRLRLLKAGEKLREEDPAEFCCALLGSVMRDPVMLPGSGNVCDRAVRFVWIWLVENDVLCCSSSSSPPPPQRPSRPSSADLESTRSRTLRSRHQNLRRCLSCGRGSSRGKLLASQTQARGGA